MSIDVHAIFDRGGRELIDLLEYCVLAVKQDVLFVYLAREYRYRPTAVGAIAIHDMFCATNAPARISLDGLLPPKDRRLEDLIRLYRRSLTVRPAAAAVEGEVTSDVGTELDEGVTLPMLPPKYLFDFLAHRLIGVPDNAIAEVERAYNPLLTPHENLPTGKLTQSQRAFVNNIWLPVVRPTLVTAGFWRMATVA